jgi:predicted dehydrogenase
MVPAPKLHLCVFYHYYYLMYQHQPGSSLYTRRNFIYTFSLQAGFTAFALHSMGCGDGGSNAETQRNAAAAEQKAQNKLGIALVGLGKYAEGQLAPSLQKTGHCYLAGIVTGTPEKAAKWKKKYDIPDKNIYNYNNFDTIRDNPDIHIVYIVLPNALHAEYVIRAAQAGKHVICEKPMAVSVEECDRMIAACKEAGKMLSIGYRLHFEPHNLEIMRVGKQQVYGAVKKVIARHGMNGTEGWRLDKKLAGGGPLMDVGIYCVQAARYTTGMEPVAVTAKEGPKTKPDIFKTVEESLTWQMEFANGITADCACSYSEEQNLLRMEAQNGWAELSPAYAYQGIKGKTKEGAMDLPEIKQQAFQMDDFAQAVRNGTPGKVPGEMGKQDVKIMMAIYESMNNGGKKVLIN